MHTSIKAADWGAIAACTPASKQLIGVQMWDLLEWQGKHPQAPVAVAAKPYYFSELNIKRTMRNILKHHPEFFASQHMLDTVRSGDIIALDANFFCEVCQQSCHKLACQDRTWPART